jgi:hypothetical protein
VRSLLSDQQVPEKQGSPMAALARMMSRAIGIEIEVDTLRLVPIFCGSGLLLSLVMMIHGCDLSVGL